MTLLLTPDQLGERREAVRGPLAPLRDSLRADLAPVLATPPIVPLVKARLSRAGGVCSRDGARLAFDPFSPDAHRCPRCGAVERGEAHYRAWLMWYQLWLAERAVQGAVLHMVDGQPDELALATSLLSQYAESYVAFPNRDNALGPARVFFSTYLESIWLLQICIAVSAVERSGGGGVLTGRVRERVIEPAAGLIASFDEGGSNRQVWNNVALLAAGRSIGDEALVQRAIHGRSGIVSHLSNSLLPDGSWFEGENYHVFAHRGLWYGLTMAAAAGIPVPGELIRRFDEGYLVPWLTALPDLTMPSRRDSPYAVSLRQWRFAEMAELGLARREDGLLRGALARLYLDDIPRADTGRSRSAADVERNEPAAALTRSDLGWRALLHALPVLGDVRPSAPASAVLRGQGLGVLRQDAGRIYVALDYGHSGGGHGHPDRLGVLLCDGPTRWLDDPGTGSYVDSTLHWYRSTLAHNAPLVDGRSQLPTRGTLSAFDERRGASWIEARASGFAPGVAARRTIVAMSDYVMDIFEWTSERSIRLELPIHADGETLDAEWTPMLMTGGRGLEDGFEFVTDSERAEVRELVNRGDSSTATSVLRFVTRTGAPELVTTLFANPPIEWWRAYAPGVPGAGRQRFHLARWKGTGGRLTTIWDLRGQIRSCSASPHDVTVERRDGSSHVHERAGRGWQVTVRGRHNHVVMLGGALVERSDEETPTPLPSPAHLATPHVLRSTPVIFELGEKHYRRSEQSWSEAGEPRALVALSVEDRSLVVGVRMFSPDPMFVPASAVNDMDNEHPDVNGDGVQLYVRASPSSVSPASTTIGIDIGATVGAHTDFSAAWMAVPDSGESVRIREITGSGADWLPEAGWQRMPDGYRMLLLLPLERLGDRSARRFSLDIIVNETTPGRERRRGQLVLSGARGEWVYLRGDRQSPDRFLPFIVDDA